MCARIKTLRSLIARQVVLPGVRQVQYHATPDSYKSEGTNHLQTFKHHFEFYRYNMTVSFDDLKHMIDNFENQIFDRKSQKIFSDPSRLAALMVAFGNNKDVSSDYGGIIVIGVDDKGNYENLIPEQGHEELIMNVAQDKIFPPMVPNFEVVRGDDKTVYVVTIPKMTDVPYALKTDKGYIYKRKVGSTIRNLTFDALQRPTLERSDDISQKEQRIRTNLLVSDKKPSIRIAIIPLDTNSKITELGEKDVDWLEKNEPRTIYRPKKILRQNEIHFESPPMTTTDSSREYQFIVNQYGECSAIEHMQAEYKTVHLGRQAVFLASALFCIMKTYKHFRYTGCISVKVELDNVLGFKFSNSNPLKPLGSGSEKFIDSPVRVKRTRSTNMLDVNHLVYSIVIEICRACDWIANESKMRKYIDATLNPLF